MSQLSPYRPSEYVTAVSQTTAIGGPFPVSIFPGRRYERQITKILVTGPVGSLISGYLGTIAPGQQFTTAGRGDFNENDLNQPIRVPIGWQIYMVWNVNTLPAAATLFFTGLGDGGR